MASSKKTKGRETGKNEIIGDYLLLEVMSKDLSKHNKSLKQVGKRIAAGMDSYNKYGLIDVLSMVSMHIERAQKELEKAKRELKFI